MKTAATGNANADVGFANSASPKQSVPNAGRRSRTYSDRKRGRYIMARPAMGRKDDIAFSATLRDTTLALELELQQRAAGGIARTGDASSLEFARLEFALLVALAQRKLSARDPELAFVSSSELAEMLEFKSREADSENVRELVRRVRRKLKSEGIENLIESRQGVGYRLAWEVEPPPHAS